MPPSRLLPSLLALCLLIPALPAGAGDRAVARVGGEAVTEREVEEVLARTPGVSRAEALRLLEEKLLVLQWAKKKGIPPASEAEVDRAVDSIRERNGLSPEEFERALASQGITLESFRSGLSETIQVNRAVATALADRVGVSDEEVAARYAKDYPARPTITVSHIFFALPEGLAPSAREEKEALAREVAAKLRSGELTFPEAAKRYSEDPATRDSGGRLGTFQPGELFPEMEKAASGLAPGQVGGPIAGPDGLHIILLESRGVSSAPSLDSVKEELADRVREEKGEAARKAWLKELEKEYLIQEFPDPEH